MLELNTNYLFSFLLKKHLLLNMDPIENLVNVFLKSGDNLLINSIKKLVKTEDLNINTTSASFERLYFWLKKQLKFRENHQSIFDKIAYLNSINSLNLSGKGLSELPDEIELLSNVDVLDLSHNAFKEIPKQIFKIQGLIDLNLSNNLIADSDLNAGVSSVVILNIENNCLNNFDFCLVFPSLVELNLSGNPVSISKYIQFLPYLELINLTNCQLTFLPSYISNCQHLSDLILDENFLSSIDHKILEMESLKSLSVNKNSFKQETLRAYEKRINHGYSFSYSYRG